MNLLEVLLHHSLSLRVFAANLSCIQKVWAIILVVHVMKGRHFKPYIDVRPIMKYDLIVLISSVYLTCYNYVE